jgi:hypothetical protein
MQLASLQDVVVMKFYSISNKYCLVQPDSMKWKHLLPFFTWYESFLYTQCWLVVVYVQYKKTLWKQPCWSSMWRHIISHVIICLKHRIDAISIEIQTLNVRLPKLSRSMLSLKMWDIWLFNWFENIVLRDLFSLMKQKTKAILKHISYGNTDTNTNSTIVSCAYHSNITYFKDLRRCVRTIEGDVTKWLKCWWESHCIDKISVEWIKWRINTFNRTISGWLTRCPDHAIERYA